MDPLFPHLYYQRPIQGVESPRTVEPQLKTGGPDFATYMKEQIGKVNSQQQAAEMAMNKWATGETDNIGEVMTAVKKAEVAFHMLVEVRNKMQDAYQEIMRMQI